MVDLDVTADESQVRYSGRPDSARLTVSLQLERPHDAALSFSLQGIQAVSFSRGKGPAQAVRVRAGSESHLKVEIPDRFLSTSHASLQRVLGNWLLEDKGSKNGTFIDGEKIERHELTDGAIFEIGHTFCVFRAAAEGDDPRPDAQSFQPDFASQLDALERAAKAALPVMLRGESGTGKEVLARRVHQLSGRSGLFQAINCAAIAPGLLESELFGYKKGAFSGALEDRPGLVRSAENGTLFLDEIGDLPLPAQGAFLRVLEESEVLPVGGTKAMPVDFRLVVATHRDLEQMAEDGAFRPDLLARLTGFTVNLLPLRERPEDFGTLVAALLARHAPGREFRFTQAAGRALFRYSWPLNVRELEKALALAAALSSDGIIDAQHLPQAVREAKARPNAVVELDPAEQQRREELLTLFKEHHGNVTAVAKALGKARVQVQRWMRRYNIRPSVFR
jgi:DNA-binding NtrC family response regulator